MYVCVMCGVYELKMNMKSRDVWVGCPLQ